MKNLFAILFLFFCLLAKSQDKSFNLVSMMEGRHQLESGTKVDIWGYGWDTLNPFITLPGPLLEMNEGDSVLIQFRNISAEAHTIHLHGLDVSQVNDGVPSTSFYVWNGDTAYYSFNANYSGTFLYHCHVTTTLHLTMGMYGLIVVNRPDSLLFEDGPRYDQQYKFLTSDLDSTMNPVSPPPFNEITPNYFMINGQRGSMLDDDTISLKDNEKAVLRLANVAYAKTTYIFPEGVNVEVFMSDGRPLPQSFITDTLEIYSGERYSVMINIEDSLDDIIKIEYYNMVTNDLKYKNQIPIKGSFTPELSINKNRANTIRVYPNPFKTRFILSNPEEGTYKLYNSNLTLVKKVNLNTNKNIVTVGNEYSKGLYFLISPTGNSLKLLKQ